MPGINEVPAEEITNTSSNEQIVEEQHQQLEEMIVDEQQQPQDEEIVPPPEITQTDKLNKVLLNAFLDRFNKGELLNFRDSNEENGEEESSFNEN